MMGTMSLREDEDADAADELHWAVQRQRLDSWHTYVAQGNGS